jgi:hypothetical protein
VPLQCASPAQTLQDNPYGTDALVHTCTAAGGAGDPVAVGLLAAEVDACMARAHGFWTGALAHDTPAFTAVARWLDDCCGVELGVKPGCGGVVPFSQAACAARMAGESAGAAARVRACNTRRPRGSLFVPVPRQLQTAAMRDVETGARCQRMPTRSASVGPRSSRARVVAGSKPCTAFLLGGPKHLEWLAEEEAALDATGRLGPFGLLAVLGMGVDPGAAYDADFVRLVYAVGQANPRLGDRQRAAAAVRTHGGECASATDVDVDRVCEYVEEPDAQCDEDEADEVDDQDSDAAGPGSMWFPFPASPGSPGSSGSPTSCCSGLEDDADEECDSPPALSPASGHHVTAQQPVIYIVNNGGGAGGPPAPAPTPTPTWDAGGGGGGGSEAQGGETGQDAFPLSAFMTTADALIGDRVLSAEEYAEYVRRTQGSDPNSPATFPAWFDAMTEYSREAKSTGLATLVLRNLLEYMWVTFPDALKHGGSSSGSVAPTASRPGSSQASSRFPGSGSILGSAST